VLIDVVVLVLVWWYGMVWYGMVWYGGGGGGGGVD
jgi:hypothetical protein